MSDEAPTQRHAAFLAAAIYDIRCLLPHLVGRKEHTAEVEAAGIAYALHNDALAAIEGRAYDIAQARRRLEILNERLGSNILARLDAHLAEAPPSPKWQLSWKFHLATKRLEDVERVFTKVLRRCDLNWAVSDKGLRGARPGTWVRVQQQLEARLGDALIESLDRAALFGTASASAPQRSDNGVIEVSGSLWDCSHSELSGVEFTLSNRVD